MPAAVQARRARDRNTHVQEIARQHDDLGGTDNIFRQGTKRPKALSFYAAVVGGPFPVSGCRNKRISADKRNDR